MKTRTVNTPTLAAIAATRGILGVGLGLLIAPKIPREVRQAVGWTLLGVGLASTIPLAALVFRGGSHTRVGDTDDGLVE